jgi:hypothetical protein
VKALFGVAELIEDAPASSQKVGAFRGEADLARCAVKQPRTEVPFQRSDVTAGRCARDIQLVGGTRKGAALGDPDEHTHCKQLVHLAIVQKIGIP